jgi:hypothetical protein
LLKLNLGNPGKVQRRQPYILIMHSISNRNFEIHIFALLTSWRKFQNVTGRQLRSTICHTSTRREIVRHACKLLPPWPIIGGAAPQPRGQGTMDSNHSHALRLLHNIGTRLNQTSRTWRPHLLSRLACSHPSTSTTVRAIQCPEHTTAGRTAPAGTKINQVSLVA